MFPLQMNLIFWGIIIHPNHATKALSLMKEFERVIDVGEVSIVCDVLVNTNLTIHVLVHKAWHLTTTLVPPKSSALPNSSMGKPA